MKRRNNIFTGRPMPLPLPNLTGETDCEDQGFSLISDGCLSCVTGFDANGKSIHPKFIKQRSPSNSSLPNGGPLYWVCPKCKGYYGEVRRASSTGALNNSSTKEK